jgi:rhamnose transport system ATP-binding protein
VDNAIAYQGELLEAISIKKSFAGVDALKGVSFELKRGEVHALVGENGAGKSTLIKIVTGAYRADDGVLKVLGQVVENNNPPMAHSLGIAAIYQQPALFPDLTVAENIAFGQESGGPWRRIDWGHRRGKARELLDRIGANIDPDTDVRGLTMPEQQLVEIARALGTNARILIMDEPTASLSGREVDNLFRVIRGLRDHGVGIIYISHRLDELFQLANRVTVLRDGSTVGTRPMTDVTRPELIRLMVGRAIAAVYPRRAVNLGDVALEVRQLTCRAGNIHNVSLSVRTGEILGLAGLVGAGRTELGRALSGITPADAGTISLHGRPVVIDSPARALHLGIAYVPEDRRRHGIIPEMSVAENSTMTVLTKIARHGFLDFDAERAIAESWVNRFAIRTPSIRAPVGELSGGNQQKVALASRMAAQPSVIILDEPTQGVDVGAKAEIHRLMGDLAEKGMAILMISSELPEILGMSDRIAVMHRGKVAGILDRAESTQENVLALALGTDA